MTDPYNDPFLRQLPSSGGPGPRWSIARPMIVIRSAIRSPVTAKDVYADPLQVGTKLLSLVSYSGPFFLPSAVGDISTLNDIATYPSALRLYQTPATRN